MVYKQRLLERSEDDKTSKGVREAGGATDLNISLSERVRKQERRRERERK